MKKRIGDLVKNIIAAAEESDEGLVAELLNDAKECGYEVSLVDSEEINWEASGGARYATTRVDYELKLGEKIIAEWYAEYFGEYGCGGTGWWITQIDSDEPYWIETVLEAAEIEIDTPVVPEPESLDDFYDLDDEEEAESVEGIATVESTVSHKPFSYASPDDHATLLSKADQGDDFAQLIIGKRYEDGLHFDEQDYVKAAAYYRKSAEQGNSEAMFQLGIKYTGCWNDSGENVIPQNDAEVISWITRSAEKGHADAQNYLGSMYLSGDYISENIEEAIKWFSMAAEQGHPSAQCYLGTLYNLGKGLPKDYSRAMDLFMKSANQGNTDAQFNIGWMYSNGQGVDQCKKAAKRWYKLACSNGHEIACEHLWQYKKVPD